MRLAIGEADLASELGIEVSPGDEREMLSARTMLVLASAAAGLDPPMGPVSTDFRDLDALRASSEALRRLGFRGRSCIHPAQVPVVNDVFTPTPVQLARAQHLVERYDAALAEGAGVITDDNGKMIDEAVVRGARRIVAHAHLVPASTGPSSGDQP
jgi:citrate lyase subunit beta / citryl-CoA lyase